MHDAVCVERGDGDGQLPEAIAHVSQINRAEKERRVVASLVDQLRVANADRGGERLIEKAMLQLRYRQVLEQIGASNQLHGEEPSLIDDQELVEAGQIRMAQLG